MLKLLTCCIIFFLITGLDNPGEKRPPSVDDCVRTRRIVYEDTMLSPDGASVAYVVKAPNTTNNKNVFQLWVRDLRETAHRQNGRLIDEADEMSRIQWFAGGKEIAVLVTVSGNSSVRILDVSTGARRTSIVCSRQIADIAVDSTGMGMAIAVQSSGELESQRRRTAPYGYSIVFGRPVFHDFAMTYTIELLLDMSTKANISNTIDVCSGDEKSVKALGSFTETRNVSMSPNGRFILFDYVAPNGADRMSGVERRHGSEAFLGLELRRLGIYDTRSGSFREGLTALVNPEIRRASWTRDSQEFAVEATLVRQDVPIDGPKQDECGVGTEVTMTTLVAIRASNNSISRIMPLTTPLGGTQSATWTNGAKEVLALIGDNTIATAARSDSCWRDTTHAAASPDSAHKLLAISDDGNRVVGVLENTTTPPNLFFYDRVSNQTVLLTDLNPEYREFGLGDVEEIRWNNEFGANATGYLIKPLDFHKDRVYPLVVMLKEWGPPEYFLADTIYQTAFPPQVLAASGFVVLLANPPDDDKQPKDYPGNMGEAYNWMSSVSVVIHLLAQRKLIDEAKVGLMGFSRTSWITDFILTHSTFRFAAASSADGGLYNYGAYWLFNLNFSRTENQVGGPPYGVTLENWLKYAPAFNAERVQTPILMEYTGSELGRVGPIGGLEFFVALHRQGKAVDLFYYPEGRHILDTPSERVASLQRNVDWFRFWIQHYEQKAPDYDPDQFVRWRDLREQLSKTARMAPTKIKSDP